MRKAMTFDQWEEHLSSYEVIAIEELYPNWLYTNATLAPNEIFDAIVKYEGGIATGYEIRSIISRVYGIELD